MRKIYLLFLVLLLSMLRVNAQASLYDFAIENGTYVPLTGGVVFQTTGGDLIASVDASPSQDSKASAAVTIPAFQFAGVSYTDIRITSNGHLAFGTAGSVPTTTYQAISTSFADNKVLAPFGADLNVGATGVSDVRYQTIAGVTVVEWKNFRRYNVAESFSFQIRLEHATGIIKFVYSGNPPFGVSTSYYPQIGIKNSTTDYQYLILGSGDSWLNSYTSNSGVSSTSTCKFNGATGTVNGLTYVFTPPVPCTGIPNGGVVSIARQNVCSGATPATISVGNVNSGLSGISYKWQESTDNVTWTDVAGATTGITLSYTPPVYSGTNKYYRLKTTCSNGGGVAYSTVSEVTGSATPLSVSSLVFTGVTDSSMTINWLNGGGNRRMVVLSDTDNFTNPVDGNGAALTANSVYSGSGQQIIFDGTGNNVTVTLLSCSTTYYVRVYEYVRCGASAPYTYWYALPTSSSQVTNSTSLSTLVQNMPEEIILTGFNGSNLSTISPGWDERVGDGPFTGAASAWTNSSVQGVTTARINLYTTSRKEWIISPPVNLNVASRVTFKAAMTASASTNAAANGGMANTDDKIQVMISTDVCGNVWTPLYTIDSSNASDFGTSLVPKEVIIPNSYIGQNVRIGFKATDGPIDDINDYYFHLADIAIEALPPCSDVFGVTLTNFTKDGATVSWSASTPVPAVGYEYEVRTTGEPGDPGYIQRANVPSGVTTVNLSGLLADTEYKVYVRTNCNLGLDGAWTDVSIFNTLCDYPDLVTTTPATRCGQGSVNLSAAFTSGTIRWYDAQTGGTLLGTGNTVSTPIINSTTSFWVDSSLIGTTVTGGKTQPSSTSSTTSSNYGLVFNAYSDFVLETVDVYLASATAGNIVINLTTSTGTVIDTRTVAVPAGNATTPVLHTITLDLNVPSGVGYRLIAGSSPSLVRDTSGSSYPYTLGDVASITDGYINGISTTYYYFYNWSITPICKSPRTEVVATVTPAPDFTLSANQLEICEGQSSAITITTGASVYDTFVWTPSEGVSGNATSGWIFNPTVSAVYTLVASQSSGAQCSKSVTVNVSVNPLPIFTPLLENYNVCTNVVQELNVNNINEFVVGTGTATTSNIEIPTAFMNRWSQGKQQYIYTKEELNAIGVYAGDITYLAFKIVSLGSAATNSNYTIKMKSVAQSSFANSDFLTGGFTTVFGPVTYTHTASGWQEFNLTTPFSWDGNSNILLELTQNGADGLYNAETFYSVTADNKGLGAQGSSALSSTSGTLTTKRLNLKLKRDILSTSSWLPQTNLYIDQAATVPYEGQNLSKVYVKSSQNGTLIYNVNIVTDKGCSVNSSTTVNVTGVNSPIVETQSFCTVTNVEDILVSGIVTGGLVKWYETEGGNVEITSISTSGTYFVEQEINGCSSSRVSVEVNIVGIDVPPVVEVSQSFCGVSTVADLVATPLPGNTIGWFDSLTSVQPLALDVELVGASYYVAQFNGVCWSPKTLVLVSVTEVPSAPNVIPQNFCGDHTLADIDLGDIGDATLNWYSTATSLNVLPLSTVVVTGTYYVSKAMNGCESARVAISVVSQPGLSAPMAPVSQFFCGQTLVSQLQATASVGGTIGWFNSQTSESPLNASQSVSSGVYYVSQFNGACWSPRVQVQVTVNTVPLAPNNSGVQLCGAYTFGQISLGQSTNAILKWYLNSTTTTVIPSGTNVVTGAYYVSQTVGGCESPRVLVNVTQTDALSAPSASSQSFCGFATVADLVVVTSNGAEVRWYASANAPNALPSNTQLATGTYYVVQFKNGCESSRVGVPVYVSSLNAPLVNPFNFCGSATVADLYVPVATGVVYKWYNSPTNTTALASNSALQTGVYFVSRTQNGCESSRTAVQVTIHSLPSAPSGVSPQTFIEGSTLNDVIMNQQNVTWYITYSDSQTGTNPLSPLLPLVNGTTYYGVVIGTNGCPSLPFEMTVNVYLSTDEFVKNDLKYYPNPVVDILNVSYSERILQIEVFDLLGKRIKIKSTNDTNVSIDLSDLSVGTYMVQLKTDNKTQFLKIIKK